MERGKASRPAAYAARGPRGTDRLGSAIGFEAITSRHFVKRRQQPEAAIQRAVIEHLRWRHFPGCFWFAIPNGGYRRPVEAAIMQALGVVAGVPDLIFIHGGKIFALELKASPSRQPTPAQIETMKAMRTAGAIVEVAHSVDEAIAWLERWQLIRRNNSKIEGRS